MRRRFFKTYKNSSENLTLVSLEDNNEIYLNVMDVGITGEIEMKVNGDYKWMPNGAVILNKGNFIEYRGTISNISAGLDRIGTFMISKKVNLYGDCTSILKDRMLFHDSLAYLFENTPVVNIHSTFLPATTLANSCYKSMFYGCTSLTTAPNLPATTLANHCYSSMFSGCTSLVNAPALPATTLKGYCYNQMFDGCTALTTAPELPATALANFCYNWMFNNCSKLNYIKMLATDISATYCLNNWVKNVASSGTFVKNTAMTTLPTATSSGIPRGWTVQNATS